MKYNVGKLYVGKIGKVSQNKENKDLQISQEGIARPFIIFAKAKEKLEHSYDRDYGYQEYLFWGVDVLTKKKYFLWSENRYQTLRNHCLSGCAIQTYWPLEQCMRARKSKISKKELLTLYDCYNSQKQNEDSKEVNDNILNLIIKTSEKVKDMDIDEDIKWEIVGELSELGEYYVNEMLQISNSDLTLDNTAYAIQLECVKKLVEIERRVEDKNWIEQNSLKRQLTTFKKKLGTGN